MNKHQEVWQIIKRLEDARDYVERGMMTDLTHVDESVINEASEKVEKLFFLLEKIAYKAYTYTEIEVK